MHLIAKIIGHLIPLRISSWDFTVALLITDYWQCVDRKAAFIMCKKKEKKKRTLWCFSLKVEEICLVQIHVHSQVLKHYWALFHPAAFTLAPIAVKSEVHHICQKAARLTVSLHHLPLTIQFVVDWQHPDAAGVMNGLPCSQLTRLALYFLCKKKNKLIVIVIYGSYHQAGARNTV